MGQVKVYKHSDTNAPVLAGQVGRMVAILDAVLVDGFNQVNISALSRVASLVTVVTSTAHGYNDNDVVLIGGATPSEYNGEYRINVIDNVTFTYSVAGLPVTPATGSMTVKRAPAGFSKPFSSTNRAVYRSNDPNSNKRYFRVIDDGSIGAGASEFAVSGWETMTSIDVGTGRFPPPANDANGHYCRKSSTNDVTARAWTIVSDGKTVYIFIDYGSVAATATFGSQVHSMSFGDTIPNRPSDQYCSFVGGSYSANTTTQPTATLFGSGDTFTTPGYASGVSMNRDINGVSVGKPTRLVGICFFTTLGISAKIRYPNDADKSLVMGPIMMTHDEMWRANLPGAYESFHGRFLDNGTVFDSVRGYEGRQFMLQYGNFSNTSASIILDITGPWE